VRALDAPPQQALVFEVKLWGWPCIFYGRLDPYSLLSKLLFLCISDFQMYIRIILLFVTSICFIESLGFLFKHHSYITAGCKWNSENCRLDRSLQQLERGRNLRESLLHQSSAILFRNNVIL
jgi:hypothetical protein